MGRPNVELNVNFPSRGDLFTCGDIMSGQVRLKSQTSFDITSVDVVFLGRIGTDARESPVTGQHKGSELRNERVDIVRITQRVFPMPELGNALSSSKQLTLPAGEHTFPFEIRIPKTAPDDEASKWPGMLLPPAVPKRGNASDGFFEIGYDAVVYVRNPGYFTRRQRKNQRLRFLPTIESSHPITEKRLPASGSSTDATGTLDLYDRITESWGHMFRRMIGTAVPDWQIGLTLTAQVVGPIFDVIFLANKPIKEGISLKLHAEYLGLLNEKMRIGQHGPHQHVGLLNQEKMGERPAVSLESLQINLVWYCPFKASNQERAVKGVVSLVKNNMVKKSLEFDEQGNTDLSVFFGDATIPDQLVPTFDTPNVKCEWLLEVVAVFAPCHGAPIVPRKLKIKHPLVLAAAVDSFFGAFAPPSYKDQANQTFTSDQPSSSQQPETSEPPANSEKPWRYEDVPDTNM